MQPSKPDKPTTEATEPGERKGAAEVTAPEAASMRKDLQEAAIAHEDEVDALIRRLDDAAQPKRKKCPHCGGEL